MKLKQALFVSIVLFKEPEHFTPWSIEKATVVTALYEVAPALNCSNGVSFGYGCLLLHLSLKWNVAKPNVALNLVNL